MAKPHILLGETVAGLSGLEQLQAIVAGRFGQPTMCETLGFRLVAAGEGEATFVGRPTGAMMNPFGTVHGGWAASVLDSAMGCAVHSTLASGENFTTLELKVNLTRALRPDMAPLTALGTIVTRGRRIAVSEARLLDAEGRVCAAGTSTCLIVRPDGASG